MGPPPEPGDRPRRPEGRARATAMLVGVTLLWGASFPWTKNWQVAAHDCPGGKLLASLTLIALRMPLALLLLGLSRPSLLRAPAGREHAAGALLGAVFFAGFALQTWGLAWTTPALSAFFTSLGSAWVPVLAWLWLRVASPPVTLLGLGVGLAGCAVLVEGGWAMGAGEWLTLAASLIFAGQLLVLDRLARGLDPGHFTAAFFGATGLLAALGAALAAAAGPGLGAWLGWAGEMLSEPAVLRDLVLQALLPTALAFHWMNTYQPRVSATRAALVYLLEPVFTAIFSVWWGHDRVTAPLVVGGALILAGNLVAELPTLAPRRRPAPPPGVTPPCR
jgi:drug/metabolite transporter (DMT)-like permease